MTGTPHPPIEATWTNGPFTTNRYSRTFYRCGQCLLYYRDHAEFVEHLDETGACPAPNVGRELAREWLNTMMD